MERNEGRFYWFLGCCGAKTRMFFRLSPFCEIETKDFIASGARLAPDAAKFSYFREATLPLVSRMFGDDHCLPFRGDGQK